MSFDVPQVVPRGVRGWDALVDQLTADETCESMWIERKGDVDPSTKEGLAKIAKFILGMANRIPANAAKRFDGYGALFIGVTRGSRDGVPLVEHHQIENGIRKFLGPNPPPWEINYVNGNGDDKVHIIVVDPPKPGDPIYACHADGTVLSNGFVYMRNHTETTVAKGGDIDALNARCRAAPDPAVRIDFDGAIRAYTYDENVVEDFLAGEQQRLLKSVRPPAKRAPTALDRAINTQLTAMNAFGIDKESRSEAEFLDEVELYMAECRETMSEVIDWVIGQEGTPGRFAVHNGKRQLDHLEVHVHVAGPIEAVHPMERDPRVIINPLPNPPRLFGDRAKNFGSGLNSAGLLSGLQNVTPTWRDLRPANVPQATWRNGGSIDVELNVSLRSEQSHVFDDDEMIVVQRTPESDDDVTVDWEATVDGVNEVFRGTFTVEVADAIDITQPLREYLALLAG